MPRAAKTSSSKKHLPAAQLASKRSFAVPDNQVEKLLPGHDDSFAPEAGPSSELGPSDVSFSKLKKGKLPASSLVPDVPLHPYSRSHTRREKRKAKQQLAGGKLDNIASALSDMIDDIDVPPGLQDVKPSNKKTGMAQDNSAARRKEEKGKIGEGKGRTLSETGRRKQVALEAKRIPAVMEHPAFKTNPWATIRLHASNTLSTNSVPGKKEPTRRAGGMDVEP